MSSGVEVRPVVVAAGEAVRGWVGHFLVAVQPGLDNVMEELLGPEEACVALAADESFLFGDAFWNGVCVEFIGFADAFIEGFGEF